MHSDEATLIDAAKGTGSSAVKFAIGYEYSLSKRTLVYVHLDKDENSRRLQIEPPPSPSTVKPMKPTKPSPRMERFPDPPKKSAP